MSKLFNVSSSPHVRNNDTTQRIMRDVAIAMLPATAVSYTHLSLTLACILATLMVAIVAGNAYVPILIGGELFKKAYQDMHLDPKNLSQVLGVVGCCVIPLIPWSAAGAYMSGALGVETFSYAPWAIFCYAGIVIAVIWGYLGIGILKMTPEQIAAAEAEERGEESA